jgi:hypothetical protein
MEESWQTKETSWSTKGRLLILHISNDHNGDFADNDSFVALSQKHFDKTGAAAHTYPTQELRTLGKGWPRSGESQVSFAQDSSPQQIRRTRMERSYFAYYKSKIELRIIWSTLARLEQKRCEFFVREWGISSLSVCSRFISSTD